MPKQRAIRVSKCFIVFIGGCFCHTTEAEYVSEAEQRAESDGYSSPSVQLFCAGKKANQLDHTYPMNPAVDRGQIISIRSRRMSQHPSSQSSNSIVCYADTHHGYVVHPKPAAHCASACHTRPNRSTSRRIKPRSNKLTEQTYWDDHRSSASHVSVVFRRLCSTLRNRYSTFSTGPIRCSTYNIVGGNRNSGSDSPPLLRTSLLSAAG